MHTRAQQLIRQLRLQPHPEGGHYAEQYRSPHRVRRPDGRERSALTTIFFLLTAGELSRWHRVHADEAWHFYEGASLELYIATAAASAPGNTLDNDHLAEPRHSGHPRAADYIVRTHRLGEAGVDTSPVAVVPAQAWQAARSVGAYTLVGCTVAPGFEFEDFTLIDQLPPSERPPLPTL